MKPLFDKIFCTVTKFVVKHSVEICMGGAIVGVAAIVYTTNRATLKVDKVVKDENLTKKEKLKKSVVPTAPVAASVIFALASIGGMYYLGKKKQAALLGLLLSTQQMFQVYRNNVREEKGSAEEAKIFAKSVVESKNLDKKVEDVPVPKDGKLIWCDSITGQFFEATELDVLKAEYTLNKILTTEGEVCFNEFLSALGCDETDEGSLYGWSQELGYDWFGYMWVDFQHVIHRDKLGKEYRLITYPYLPHLSYECNLENNDPVLIETVGEEYDVIMDPLVDTDLWKKHSFPRH